MNYSTIKNLYQAVEDGLDDYNLKQEHTGKVWSLEKVVPLNEEMAYSIYRNQYGLLFLVKWYLINAGKSSEKWYYKPPSFADIDIEAHKKLREALYSTETHNFQLKTEFIHETSADLQVRKGDAAYCNQSET